MIESLSDNGTLFWIVLAVLGCALVAVGALCYSIGHDIGFRRGRRFQMQQPTVARDASGKRLRERL